MHFVVELAFVVMVRVAFPAAVPVMLTGVVEPKLNVGWTPPEGPDVMAAVSVTLPEKPPLGVIVIAEVFPVVAPETTVTAVPEIVNVGGGVVTEI